MISLCNLSRGLVFFTALFSVLVLSGCVTSNEVLLNEFTTPLKAGKYELQYYEGDGRWTKFVAGSLALVNRRYTWTENSEVSLLVNSSPERFKFWLVDIGNSYFIIVIASADLRNQIWGGNYRYGIARRTRGAFLYDFPSCLDLLVSQGFANYQIETIEAYECLYSSKASLTNALTTYAKRAAKWKRLAPSGH